MEKITYGCATKLYPNSFGPLKLVEEQKYTKPKNLEIIVYCSSNDIDANYFDPKLYDGMFKEDFQKSLNIEPDDFVFAFVSRVNHEILSFYKNPINH